MLRPAFCLLVLCSSLCPAARTGLLRNVFVRFTRLNSTERGGVRARERSHAVQFDESLGVYIAARHNEERRKVNAANMIEVKYDNNLAEHVKEWIERCTYLQASRYTPWKLRQNLASPFSDAKYSEFDDAYEEWVAQKKNVDLKTLTCNGSCHNYLTIIKWDIIQVGCSFAECPILKSYDFEYVDTEIVGCEYFSPYTDETHQPYLKGKTCSSCPKSYPRCIGMLCTGSVVDVYPVWSPIDINEKASLGRPAFATIIVNLLLAKLHLEYF